MRLRTWKSKSYLHVCLLHHAEPTVLAQLCSWQPSSSVAFPGLSESLKAHCSVYCPLVHVFGFLFVRPAVLQAGTGPGCMCRVTKQGFGLFGLWEKKGDRPPAIGACPLLIPQPFLSTGCQVGILSCGTDLLKTPANIEQDSVQTLTHLLSYSLHCWAQTRREREHQWVCRVGSYMCTESYSLYFANTNAHLWRA